MSRMIRFRTLGGLELSDSQGRDLHALLSKPKRLALLAYLASHNHHASRRRDAVVALFWPDMDAAHARGSLRQALRFLRRELGDGVLNGHSEEELGFEPHSFECDAVTFELACDAGRLSEAMQLYRGDFLDGFYIAGESAELERWIEGERTRLRQMAARAAAELSQHAERKGNLAQAVEAARQGVALDPDDEKGLARLIALLDRLGDRAGALSTFETFRRRLEKEYDATPSPETAARIQAIRTRQTPFAEVAMPRLSARRRPVRRVLWSVALGVVATALIGWLSVSETHRSSVAVLPLANATQDTALTYLTEGLSEGVTAALSRIPGLRVTTDTTDAVLAWTLRRQGDSLVLAVELRGTATSASQWAREFPLSASGALAVEGRVVGEVVGQLRPRLIDSIDLRQLHRTTASADAYLLYLQGTYFLSKRNSGYLTRARDLFAAAIERDPVYAAAYSGLGYSYGAMAFYGVIPTRQAFPLMEAAAKPALQTDSTLGSAYTLLGVATSFYRWHWAMAESEFRRGIDLDPNDPESHNKFGMYLRTLGRFDEAEAEMRRSVGLDPLTRHFAFQLGKVLACAGRPADAAVQFAKQLALDSMYPAAHYELAKALASRGDFDAAINEFATGARQWGDTVYWRLVHGRRGRAGYMAARVIGATRALESLRMQAKHGFVSPVRFAREYIVLDQPDESIAWLRRGFAHGDVNLALINCDPEYAPLWTDPRLQDLRRRMGLQ